MDAEAAVSALETAIADVGALLVRLQKFRDGASAHARLLAATLDLGDRARGRHRRETLDVDAAAELAREAEALRGDAARALADVTGGARYRTAVAAHAAGDAATLARVLPLLFDRLEHVPAPPALYASVPWLRRNRPRDAADVAAAVVELRDTGLAADGEPTAPAVDPELPAVPLLPEAPPGDPLALRVSPAALPPVVFRLVDSDEYLVHVARLHAPFDVVLPATLDPDEVGEIPLDHPAYRAALRAALASHGIAAVDA